MMASEDITFCANASCADTKCERNMKNIRLPIDHSFMLFPDCKKWKDSGAEWLLEQFDGGKNAERNAD